MINSSYIGPHRYKIMRELETNTKKLQHLKAEQRSKQNKQEWDKALANIVNDVKCTEWSKKMRTEKSSLKLASWTWLNFLNSMTNTQLRLLVGKTQALVNTFGQDEW